MLKIMKSTQKLYLRLCDEVREKYNITQSEFDVIAFLNNHPQFNTGKDICEMRMLPKSCVSVAADRLSKMGLIKCTVDEQDRRIVRMEFTDKSVSIRTEIKLVQKRFGNIVFKEMSYDTVNAFSDTLVRISKNVDCAMGETCS